MNSKTIAVAGGGIAGLCAAWALSRSGCAVTLFDGAGFPADNASAMAGGMLAPYGEIEHMGPSWVAAGLHGIVLWEAITAALGDDCGLTRRGSLLLAHPEDAHMLARFRAHLPDDGSWRDQDPGALERDLSSRFPAGLHLMKDAHLDPGRAMKALCAALEQPGRLVKEHADPEDLKKDFSFVIDCRGLGCPDPGLRAVKGEVLILRNPDFTLSRPVRLMHPRYPLYIVPRADHVFLIGATNIESAGQSRVSLRSAMELMSALYSLHPSFGEAEILDMRAGLRPAYPDNLPRITLDGPILRCNGLFRHGWLLSPVMAECAADYIAGRTGPYRSLFERNTR